MCKFVKQLVETKAAASKDLDVEERNLLSVAYKNVVGSKRASWYVKRASCYVFISHLFDFINVLNILLVSCQQICLILSTNYYTRVSV